MPLGISLGSNGAHSSTDDGRTCGRGMDLETRAQHAHTSDASACHPHDRSATLLRMHGAGEQMGVLPAVLGNDNACMEIVLTPCVCFSCAAACAVWCAGCAVHAQVWCVCRDGSCSGLQRTLSEEQYLQVAGRCAIEGNVQTQDTRSICQQHHDRWLQHYKPTRCAACPQPLSTTGSMPCPEWVRPCYKAAVAAKKKQAADTQPMEVEQENDPPQPTFHIDVRQHTNMQQGVPTI